MYLLDTNVVSELRKLRPFPSVVRWLEASDDSALFLSAVTIGEIRGGIEITREQDPAKALEIENRADRLAQAYRTLPMDIPAFRVWARLMHRKSDTPYEDAMIAATALVHGLTVVTRNVSAFELFGVKLLDPFRWTARFGRIPWRPSHPSAGLQRMMHSICDSGQGIPESFPCLRSSS